MQVTTLRRLFVATASGVAAPAKLSAASGLVRLGNRLYVVADDELSLGVFDLSNDEAGRLVRIFEGELPASHDERKAAKPDLESLTMLPAFDGCPYGALMAIGSGSNFMFKSVISGTSTCCELRIISQVICWPV